MAPKRNLTSTSKDATAEDVDVLDINSSNDTADNVDVLDINSSMIPLRRSKRLKSSASTMGIKFSRLSVRPSQSEVDSLYHLVSTETSSLGETTAQAVKPATKIPPTCSIERSWMVTQSSQPPQHKSDTACLTESSHYRQLGNQPTSCPSNNDGLLEPLASLKQRPATPTADNDYGYSEPNLPSGKSEPERAKLLELPLDILYLIADNLDVVARACLRYAHPALGYWCNRDLGNLSLCARSSIVSLLLRDGASIPGQLLGVAKNGTENSQCSEYNKIVPKYCVTCRCYGHLSHCPGCQIRTCAREGT